MPMQFPELGAEEVGSGLVNVEADVFLGVLVALEDVSWPMLLRVLSHLLLGYLHSRQLRVVKTR
jgi:hypothetical protein